MLPHGLPNTIAAELEVADAEIRIGGPMPGDTRDDDELIAAFADDITSFVRRTGVARAVVVNVSSTEPEPAADDPRLPASSSTPPPRSGRAARM